MLQTKEILDTFQKLSEREQDELLKKLDKTRQQSRKSVRLDDVKQVYPGEWIAVDIAKGEDDYAPKNVHLIAHGFDRSDVWNAVESLQNHRNIFVFYNGAPSAKGFGVYFDDATDSPEVAELVTE